MEQAQFRRPTEADLRPGAVVYRQARTHPTDEFDPETGRPEVWPPTPQETLLILSLPYTSRDKIASGIGRLVRVWEGPRTWPHSTGHTVLGTTQNEHFVGDILYGDVVELREEGR